MSHAGSTQLGLIGFGQFGHFAATHLKSHFEVVAADRRPGPVSAEAGVRFVGVAQAARSPIVVLAVPIQRLVETLDEIAPELQPGALVLDVCSVKTLPMTWMRERLPTTVEIIGTHPMFGPQSAAAGLGGQRIVVCPERTDRLDAVVAFLRALGLEVIITDPDVHDRECAYTQALSQYVGRALRGLEGTDHDMTTPAATRLREAAAMVAEDSWELFEAIQTLNPYAAQMRERVRTRLLELDQRLDAAPGPTPPAASPES